MTVREHHVGTAGPPPRLEISNAAGSVTVEAVEGADALDVRVEPLDAAAEELLDRVQIEVSPSDPDGPDSRVRLRIAAPQRRMLRTPAFAIRVTTPPGASARITVASADVALRGRFGSTELTGASGDLTVDEATDLELRTASGDVHVGTVHGEAFIKSASADVRIGRTEGSLRVRAASGDVSVEHAADAILSTASGDVTVGAAAGEAVQVKTVSGDISVAVPPGRRVWLDLHTVSGRMRSHLDEDVAGAASATPDLTLTLQSVSGDLRIGRTTPAPVA